MTDKSSRVRSVPFTKEESALLAELYSSNMEEYEGKFNSASAGSSGSKRIKNDFHEEWAKSLSQNCGITKKNPVFSSVHQVAVDGAFFEYTTVVGTTGELRIRSNGSQLRCRNNHTID
ncbi:hypothetical protein QR680_012740 [Steinernema hermaphroditum]|uniref:Uncharacterized protein n=1 Tax=Steinernema hermaphroditum TaxID=289476 RepID=A0AA39M120_9BILA|nr:hypothetical protein QR680_012740 [Steinernema hermaphroditum]